MTGAKEGRISTSVTSGFCNQNGEIDSTLNEDIC